MISELAASAPPPFAQNKRSFLRDVSWIETARDGTDKSFSAAVPSGMLVNDKLHAAYWEAYSNCQQALESCQAGGLALPVNYILVDAEQLLRGYGSFDPQDGPHEMAWISCMFIEMRRWRLALAVPEGTPVPTDKIVAPKSTDDETLVSPQPD
jgi:hypothetical protein